MLWNEKGFFKFCLILLFTRVKHCIIMFSKLQRYSIKRNFRCPRENVNAIFQYSYWKKLEKKTWQSDNLNLLGSSRSKMFFKIGVLKNFAKFTGKHLCQSLFFIKKEALTLVFSCEFCEIFQSTFFYRIPPVAASVFCAVSYWYHQLAHWSGRKK